jgi:hypothetical protein
MLDTKCNNFNTLYVYRINHRKGHKHKVHVLIKIQSEVLVERTVMLSFCLGG